MADRGFLIKELLNERHVKLIILPFFGSRHRFTPQEEALTKDIAKHRLHVERSIERKKFRILHTKASACFLTVCFCNCLFSYFLKSISKVDQHWVAITVTPIQGFY